MLATSCVASAPIPSKPIAQRRSLALAVPLCVSVM
jgi:hypothetical protein